MSWQQKASFLLTIKIRYANVVVVENQAASMCRYDPSFVSGLLLGSVIVDAELLRRNWAGV